MCIRNQTTNFIGQPGDSLLPDQPEEDIEFRNEDAHSNAEIKPLIEPALPPSNNREILPESSIDDDPANKNNEAEDPPIEQPNLPNFPILNREVLEVRFGNCN